MWKVEIHDHMKSSSNDMWEIVENGYTIQQPNDPNSDDKANLQLDAQAKDIVCSSLSKDIFFRFQRLNTAKQIWDAINNAHEEFGARADPHI